MGLHQTKKFCIAKEKFNTVKSNLRDGKKKLQIIYLIRGQNPKYKPKVYKSIAKKNKIKPTTTKHFKMDKGLAWKFHQRRQAYNQQVYEKMLSITNHQGNAHQNHNEISLHTIRILLFSH